LRRDNDPHGATIRIVAARSSRLFEPHSDPSARN
jgi:hypothetical protein